MKTLNVQKLWDKELELKKKLQTLAQQNLYDMRHSRQYGLLILRYIYLRRKVSSIQYELGLLARVF